ncbi:Mitochondrial substrate carrier family protein L [Ophiocordyceps camponoti-floridani]|uniref:Mitochondrial substrate carrier family protein L n=1 Tax=Ophiocordyceps camponoti-floridani TaxID=2030778 RepID=A0A8H4VEX3_9HYPO|nr:Mitochondrial substrate carrier family protein L [Ophiocordyceps camponoti-floridani]
MAQDGSSSSSSSSSSSYKGFVAGIFSGASKLAVGHPFDTIKVRLQTSPRSRFSGPVQCLLQTVRGEGFRALYKGASPPLVGWMVMDSLMLGSLNLYRQVLAHRLFSVPVYAPGATAEARLPAWGHGLAGLAAGGTVSVLAAPVEHVKARLQVQYGVSRGERFYAGPVDCLRRIWAAHGVGGVFRGLSATMIFRSFFFVWWAAYDVLSRSLSQRTSLSTPTIQFLAGGASAQLFWLTSYPSDVVKQRIMTDPLGGSLGDGRPRFGGWGGWMRAVRTVRGEGGFGGVWALFLRAFPANASALVVFEAVMRGLP